jgi:hypothetical protein
MNHPIPISENQQTIKWSSMSIIGINPIQTLAYVGTNQPPIIGPQVFLGITPVENIDHMQAINEVDPPHITSENTLTSTEIN